MKQPLLTRKIKDGSKRNFMASVREHAYIHALWRTHVVQQTNRAECQKFRLTVLVRVAAFRRDANDKFSALLHTDLTIMMQLQIAAIMANQAYNLLLTLLIFQVF